MHVKVNTAVTLTRLGLANEVDRVAALLPIL